MQRLIKDKFDELKRLCENYDVKTMYVFGSASTERFNDNSDIDFLISFKAISIEKYTKNYFDLHYKL